MTDCINLSWLLNFPWTGLGWFIYQLEVRIWFWSSAAWPPTFFYLSLSTMYSRSLWRTNTIVFSILNKPLSPPPHPQRGLNRGFMVSSNFATPTHLHRGRPPLFLRNFTSHSWKPASNFPPLTFNSFITQSTCTVNHALFQTLPICSLSFANRNWNLITFGRKNLQKRTLKYNNCEFVNVWQNSKNKNCAEITD